MIKTDTKLNGTLGTVTLHMGEGLYIFIEIIHRPLKKPAEGITVKDHGKYITADIIPDAIIKTDTAEYSHENLTVCLQACIQLDKDRNNKPIDLVRHLPTYTG